MGESERVDSKEHKVCAHVCVKNIEGGRDTERVMEEYKVEGRRR